MLTTFDYQFLEPVAEQVFDLTGHYGSLISESTLGKRFLVEMLLREAGEKSEEDISKLSKLFRSIKSAPKKAVDGMLRVIGYTVKEVDGKEETEHKRLARIFDTICEVFTKAVGREFQGNCSALKAFIGENKKYILGGVIVALVGGFTLYARKKGSFKEAALSIMEGIKKVVAKGYNAVKRFVAWALSLVKRNNPEPKVAEAYIPAIRRGFDLAEHLVINGLISEAEGIESDVKKNILRSIFDFIKKYGFSVPKKYIFTAWNKYENLFYKNRYAEIQAEVTKRVNEIKELNIKEAISDPKLTQLSNEAMNIIRKKTAVSMLVAFTVLIALTATIMYLRKKKKEKAQVEEWG